LTPYFHLLIGDEELRRKMSISARKRYEELYTKEKFIDNMVEVFNRVQEICRWTQAGIGSQFMILIS